MGAGIGSFSVLGIGIFMSFVTGNEIFFLKRHWEWGGGKLQRLLMEMEFPNKRRWEHAD